MKKASYSLQGQCKELAPVLRGFQRQATQVRTFSRVAGVVFVLSVVMFILSVHNVMTQHPVLPTFRPLWIFLAAAAAVCGIYLSSQVNDLTRLVAPLRLVEEIQTRLPEEGPLSLKLDLRNYKQKEFLQGQQNEVLSATINRSYAMPWLEASAELTDASTFSISVVRDIKRSDEWKVTASDLVSGRHNHHRTNEQMRDRITVGLTLDPARYPGLAAGTPHLPPPPSGLTLERLQAEGHTVKARLQTGLSIHSQSNWSNRDDLNSLTRGPHALAGLVWLYTGLQSYRG